MSDSSSLSNYKSFADVSFNKCCQFFFLSLLNSSLTAKKSKKQCIVFVSVLFIKKNAKQDMLTLFKIVKYH